MTISEIVSIAAVIITGLVWWTSRKNSKAAAKKDDVDALRGILDELRIDIADRKLREKAFEARCLKYLNRIAYLMDGIRVLLNQIEQARETPCWKPDEWDPDENG